MKIEVRRHIKIPEGWSSAEEIEKTATPGDIIEVKFGKDKSHFLLNIRKGWCVHVRALDSGGEGNPAVDTVVKDATDLRLESGSRPCRINNFEEFATSNNLVARPLKDCLQLSRDGLMSGMITLPISDINLVFHNGNFAQEFCFYWKYKTNKPSSSIPFFSLPYLIFVIIAAGVVAGLLAFL